MKEVKKWVNEWIKGYAGAARERKTTSTTRLSPTFSFPKLWYTLGSQVRTASGRKGLKLSNEKDGITVLNGSSFNL